MKVTRDVLRDSGTWPGWRTEETTVTQYRQAGIGWAGLSDGEAAPPKLLCLLYTVNREAISV